MKKVMTLKQVGNPLKAQTMYVPCVDKRDWWIHTLSDGTDNFEHWSNNHKLPCGKDELVITRIGKKKGIPQLKTVIISE